MNREVFLSQLWATLSSSDLDLLSAVCGPICLPVVMSNLVTLLMLAAVLLVGSALAKPQVLVDEYGYYAAPAAAAYYSAPLTYSYPYAYAYTYPYAYY